MESIKKGEIPVVDLSKKELKPDTSCWVLTCKDVCRALEEYGCFVAKLSDEVCLELHDRIFGALDDLFDFPKEIKQKNTYDKPFRGHFERHINEGLGIDNPIDLEATRNFTNLFWPHGNNPFSETAHLYAKVVAGLDQMVMRMIHDYYGVDQKCCDTQIESTEYVLRFQKYKLKPNQNETENHEALPEHTDMTFTTIVHQNHVNGLQVQTKDGQWIDFDASPSSFLYTAGDVLQVWSNDKIKASVHRVTMRGNDVRYSLLFPTTIKGTINVAKEFVDEEHPLRYKPMNPLQYLQSQLDRTTRASIKDFCGL